MPTLNSSSVNATLILLHPQQNPLSCLSVTTYRILTGFTAPLTLISVGMYLAVLITFFKRPTLITHFTVNLISLSVINLVHSVVYWPQAISRPITLGVWLNSPLTCAVFQYFIWIMPIMTVMQDLVICGDRWVAFVAPVWYHRRRSVKCTLCGTLVVTLWLHGWYMPLNVLNYLTPMPLRQGCDGTAYPGYRAVVLTMVCYLPQALIYGSYPVLLTLLWRRRVQKARRRRDRAERLTAPSAAPAIPTITIQLCDNLGSISLRRPSLGVLKPEGAAERMDDIAKSAERSNNRLVMGVLCLKFTAIVFTMVPTVLFTVSATNRRLPPPCTWDAFHLAEHFLAVVQLVEPFVYLATLRDLRREFLSVFHLTE
ncbi:hypothetical protein BV898_19192 [Hypsibius exemplaris]|uniref:G-protein coupled receptors family 1 profile domain-containing protein n=1 Tax=Hypsibius exemplaris TaxID=2072580 RepID=A0A9X6RNV2_HYPEX|nr:hypothetical protein BV898_19192 [Hypsibius exemplaris]